MGRIFRGRSDDGPGDAPRVVGFAFPADGPARPDPAAPATVPAAVPAPTPGVPAGSPPAAMAAPPAAPSSAPSPWAAPAAHVPQHVAGPGWPGPSVAAPAAPAGPAAAGPGWGQPAQPAWEQQPYAVSSGGGLGPSPYSPYPAYPAPPVRGGVSKGVAVGVLAAVLVVAVGLVASVVLPLLLGPRKLDKPATLGGYRPISNPLVDQAKQQALEQMKAEKLRAPMVEMYGDANGVPRVFLLTRSTRARRTTEQMYAIESKGFNRYSGPLVLGAGRSVPVPGEQPVHCGTAGPVATVCMWVGRQSEGIVAVFGPTDLAAAAGITAEARTTVDH